MEIIATAALMIVVAHLVLGLLLWLRVRKLYSYPGLLGFPVFGNLYYFYRTLFICTMDSMEKHLIGIVDKYGKNGICFHCTFGYRTTVVISSPEIVKEIGLHPNLSDKPTTMYGGFTTYMVGPLTSARADDAWKLRRKEYNAGLKKSQVSNAYHSTFVECAKKLVDLMLASPSAVDAINKAIGVTHFAAMRNLFGISTNIIYHPEFIYTMRNILNAGSLAAGNPIIATLFLTLMRPIDELFMRQVGKLRKVVWEEIDRARISELLPNAELPVLIQIASRSLKYGGKKWRKDTMSELHELFFTAAQTTTSTLSSAITFLAVLPDIQEIAWQEQQTIFGNDNRDPSMDDLEQMQFLDRVIKETIRFTSPSFVGRLATEDININGITIPRGTSVIYLNRYMRMDPKYWKDPEVFDPDRFLEESETLKYSYSPFGVGVRNCPGMFYATTQMKISLSTILRRLKLRTAQKDFKFADIKFISCLMTEIKNPPVLQVEERV
ncbi:unnamed protein product [Nezara viridula]|uniref:Cytochrome P450 n=1 Tax=Nezara viridula TaxID=85310 RepID=A0A9P0H3P7_NEZVI|nr:unnamed protein product [Nezara viridula]